MVGIPNADAGEFLLDHVQRHDESGDALINYARHISQNAPASRNDELIQLARARFPNNLDLRLDIFRSVLAGTARRGTEASPATRDWSAELCRELFDSLDADSISWQPLPIEGLKSASIPWFVQQRESTDGATTSFICSLPPRGERLTGILRSQAFDIPEKLTFFIAGHDGFPDKPRKRKNLVRLRHAETDALIAEAFAPRHDTAHRFEWDLKAHAQPGEKARLEIVDGDNGSAYAWIAAGRFNPPVIQLPRINPAKVLERQRLAAGLIGTMPLRDLADELEKLLASETTAPEARAEAAKSMVALNPSPGLRALAPLIGDNTVPDALQSRVARAIATRDPMQALESMAVGLAATPANTQIRIAKALADTEIGAELLFQMISDKSAPSRILLNKPVAEKLTALKSDYRDRIAKLTAGLPPADKRILDLLAAASKAFAPGKASLATGENLFKQNCAACHSLGGEGGKVGPQLDGIGGRGAHRILEDLLDPNRNLDPAFHVENIELKDDTVITGLPQREEGQLLIVVDTTGKQIEIPKSDIISRQKSALSLMPGNFGDVLKPEQLNHLVAYLMSK